MVSKDAVSEAVSRYDTGNLAVSVLGSHSALEVCRGAKDEHLKNIVICQKGRDKTYSKHYLARKRKDSEVGIVDEVMLLNKFSEITDDGIIKHLRTRNSIFVPNRSFSVYVPYDAIENKFPVPVFGNRFLLRAEERNAPKNQYFLMKEAGIRMPKKFSDYSKIDSLAIVKAPEAKRSYERAFFFASYPKEFERNGKELIEKGIISKQGLESAVIEEFVVGAQFNFNFFYSPLHKELELLGIDTRRQTNLDGLLRLPAYEQLELRKHLRVNNIEVGHIAATLRESLLEKVFDYGEKFVSACKKHYSPGIIGPFALQGCVISEDGKEELVIFDISMRIPGSPGIAATPYSSYLFGNSVSIGRRIAMEIKEGANEERLQEIVT